MSSGTKDKTGEMCPHGKNHKGAITPEECCKACIKLMSPDKVAVYSLAYHTRRTEAREAGRLPASTRISACMGPLKRPERG